MLSIRLINNLLANALVNSQISYKTFFISKMLPLEYTRIFSYTELITLYLTLINTNIN